MGKLYLVSTPIGNREDITLRALRILQENRFILAEDTRSTMNLLQHYNIDTKSKTILSFFEGNEILRINEAVSLLKRGENIAVVSESGTPLISDPGYKLAKESILQGITVESVPGPTALITALTSSGLPTNAFLYLGFLPKKGGKARRVLEEAKSALSVLDPCKSIILYESPHRLIKTLQLIEVVFGNIEVVVARELTKIHEEIIREKVSDLVHFFSTNKPRGELVILFSLD